MAAARGGRNSIEGGGGGRGSTEEGRDGGTKGGGGRLGRRCRGERQRHGRRQGRRREARGDAGAQTLAWKLRVRVGPFGCGMGGVWDFYT